MIKWTKRLYYLMIALGVLIIILAGTCCNTKELYTDDHPSPEQLEEFSAFIERADVEHSSFKVPENVHQGDNLAIYTSHMEVWVAKDGVLSYAETLGDGLYAKTTGYSWNFIPIDKGDAGADIDIYTRFTYPNFFSRTPTLMYGQIQEIYSYAALHFSPSLIIGIALILLGAVFLIVSQTVVRRVRKAAPLMNNSVLYLGLFSLLLGIWTGNQSRLSALFIENKLLNVVLSGVPLALMLPAFSFYVRELYKERHYRAWNAICVANTAVAAASILLQLFNVLDLFQTLAATHVTILISTIIATGMAISDVRRGEATRVMRGHLVPIVICFVCAIADTVCYYIGTADNDMFGRIGFLLLVFYSGFSSAAYARELLLKSKESQLYKRLATSDTLTGLPNRTAMVFMLTDMARSGKTRCGFFMMDLNNLKDCNDSLGHKSGDEYLRICAGIIKKAFADCGKAYRIGGDEFVVVVQKPEREKLHRCIESMERLQIEHNSTPGAYPVGIAWGYAQYSRELDCSYDETIARADRNMYELKRGMEPQNADTAGTGCF